MAQQLIPVYGGKLPLHIGALALQFDDGWHSWLAEVAPMVKAHGGVATGFVNNKYLEGGEVTNTASYPAGKIGTTQENLLAAARGENEEWDVLYREFAQVADEEGFTEIATAFRMISVVEAEHERRYLKLLSRLTDGDFFKRDGKIWWQCRNCGYIVEAEQAPLMCPACKHPQAYFEPKKENY